MHPYTQRSINVARSAMPYTAPKIDHGNMAEARDLNSPSPKPTGVKLTNPEDKSVNTLARYGPYQTPAGRAKKARRKRMKYNSGKKHY